MLSLILAILLLIAVVTLIVTAYCLNLTMENLKSTRETASRLIHKKHLEYQALDKGMTEITDAYRTDELQWMDSNSKANLKIEELQAYLHERDTELALAKRILKIHDENCLPILDLEQAETIQGA